MQGNLVDTLDEMYRVSQAQHSAVHRELFRGLHVKVAVRPSGKRELIAWRNGDTPPSGAEMEILSDDAGFIQPQYRNYELPSNPEASAYRVVEMFSGALCEHQWGMQVHVDDKKHFGEANVCRQCRASWKCLFPRKGAGKASWYYNGRKRRESAVRLLMKRGPAPAQPLAETDADLAALAGVGDDKRRRLEGTPAPMGSVPTSPPMTAKQRGKAREAARQQRDEALKRRLIGYLLCVALRAALTNRWFGHWFVIESRRKFLQDAKLPDLIDEVRGRWFAWNLHLALPYVLLVCRWRHATRALPARASAGKRPHRPRQKKAGVAA